MLRCNSCRVTQSKLALTGDKPMDRSAAITFSGQLHEARESALRDSEALDGFRDQNVRPRRDGLLPPRPLCAR